MGVLSLLSLPSWPFTQRPLKVSTHVGHPAAVMPIGGHMSFCPYCAVQIVTGIMASRQHTLHVHSARTLETEERRRRRRASSAANQQEQHWGGELGSPNAN